MTALDQAFRAAGAAAWGGVAYDRLTPEMTREDQEKVRAQCPQPRTVLVAAFPYYAGDRPGNLSLYARGEDYHRALARRLNTVCDFLSRQYPMESFLPAADNSPLPEREAARLAGLGKVGRHGLLILPPYCFWGPSSPALRWRCRSGRPRPPARTAAAAPPPARWARWDPAAQTGSAVSLS